MREKVGKSRFTVFFQWFVAPESKSRLAKAAGAEPAGQRRDEKLHAVVARSTFPSQNAQNTPLSDHFWKLQCRKSARRCGAKHISKWKCTKHTILGPLLEVEMTKKCTPLWREAHFEIKMYKTHQLRTLLAVEMSKKCTPLWREAHFEVKMYKTHQLRTLLAVEMSKKCTPLWREAHFEVKMLKAPGVRTTLEVRMSKKCTPLWREAHFEVTMFKTLGVRTLLEVQMSLRFTHYTTLQDITLHYTPVHYLHYTTLQCAPLH